MKRLAFVFIFACYFFGGCLEVPPTPDECAVATIEHQMRAVLEEGCTTLECVSDIIHQRALIAAEYIKVCQ